MRLALALLAAAPLALVALVPARSHDGDGPHGHATNEEVVAARQAAFRLNGVAFFGIKAALARGDDVKTLALPAGAMAAWAKALPGMFPKGVTTPASKVLPAAWEDRAGFTAAAARFATAADKLVVAAKAGDAAAANGAFAEVGASCGGCHDKYRAAGK